MINPLRPDHERHCLPRDVDGGRVDIDPAHASGQPPAQLAVVGRPELRAARDQPLERADQKHAAAARRVDDAQRRNLLDRSAAIEQRVERVVQHELDQVVRGVEHTAAAPLVAALSALELAPELDRPQCGCAIWRRIHHIGSIAPAYV